ncbi:MAG: amidohydrolase family protein, partial [Dehalococcoidia bacterium]
FEPYRQEFFLNDPRHYPLWEKIQELGVPIMAHTGTIQGSGVQRLKYNQPIPYLDDLAADFPGLTIVGCHPSFPWQDEMLAIAAHKSNVHVELSAEWPKYFSENLVRYINTFIQDKVMFGTGYPRVEPEDWFADFDALPITAEVRPKVLLRNAARLFGLNSS